MQVAISLYNEGNPRYKNREVKMMYECLTIWYQFRISFELCGEKSSVENLHHFIGVQ